MGTEGSGAKLRSWGYLKALHNREQLRSYPQGLGRYTPEDSHETPKSWRFGSDDCTFQVWVIFRFQLLIFQGVKAPRFWKIQPMVFVSSLINLISTLCCRSLVRTVQKTFLSWCCVCSWARARKLLNRICMYTCMPMWIRYRWVI